MPGFNISTRYKDLTSVDVIEISPSDRVRALELQTIAKHCFFLQVVNENGNVSADSLV